MEARYVHTPAVAPEPRMDEPRDQPEGPADGGVHHLLGSLEAQVRAHPGYFAAGGFLIGLMLGILARR